MAKAVKADDILPLVASLEPQERVRLMRLITEQADADEAAIYAAVPPRHDEFSTDEDALSWEAEGWESADRSEARFGGTRFGRRTSDVPSWFSRGTKS